MAASSTVTLETVEMHTAGDPLRIIVSGCPEIKGRTILDKIQYMRENLDDIRKMLMREPRGHKDMYGCVIVPTDVEGADLGVIFIQSDGYSHVCGHGVISLARYAVDYGIIKNPESPEVEVNIQSPCGLMQTFVEYDVTSKKSGRTRFTSVPNYIFAKDVDVEVPDYGTVTVDIVYGGSFYAIVPASVYGLDVTRDSVESLRKAGGDTVDILRSQVKLTHPDSSQLAYIFGILLTDDEGEVTSQFCVYADRQVTRSPCGSGTTARVTQMFFRNKIKLGETRCFRGPSGDVFQSKPVKEVEYGPHPALVVELTGRGCYTGAATYTLEESDDIGRGFLLK